MNRMSWVFAGVSLFLVFLFGVSGYQNRNKIHELQRIIEASGQNDEEILSSQSTIYQYQPVPSGPTMEPHY